MEKRLTLTNLYDFATSVPNKYDVSKAFSGIKKLDKGVMETEYNLLYHLKDDDVLNAVNLIVDFLRKNNPDWFLLYYDKVGYGEKEAGDLISAVIAKSPSGKLKSNIKKCVEMLTELEWFAFKFMVHRSIIKLDKNGVISLIRIFDTIKKITKTLKTASSEAQLVYEVVDC